MNAPQVITISSVLGLIPAPFMAIYASTKHAVEGFSESVDHEVREPGVRCCSSSPATRTRSSRRTPGPPTHPWTPTPPGAPLDAYAARRKTAADVFSASMREADAPTVVADVVVKAATAKNPRLRYTAGKLASRVSVLRRYVPASAFDKQIRKLNRLPA